MTERRASFSPRKAINLTVKLAHRGVDEFIEKYATNLSVGGMFIRTREPKPLGTVLGFKVEIAGGQRVLQGRATVRWVRELNDPAGPPGMGIEFDDLDEASHALVRRMLAGQGISGPIAAPPSVAPVAPRIASVAPAIAPSVAPSVAPAAPRVVAPPPPPVEELDDELFAAELAMPPPPPDQEIPIEFADPLPDEKAVDIDFDALLNSTPEPSGAPPLPPPIDDGFDLDVDMDIDVSADFSDLSAPPPPPAPVFEPPLPETRRAAVAPAPPSGPVTLQEVKPVATPIDLPGRTVFLKPPVDIEPGGPVVGIDLGTSNTCCAVLVNGKPQILRSKDGYNIIPSIVALSRQGALLVGNRARSQLMLNPSQSVYGAKRLVGRDYDSETVKQVRERFHYQVVRGPDGKAAVTLGQHTVALEEIQGIVLAECKQMAEQHLSVAVSRAVITCPAYYSEQQREAVRVAARMAGLKVERVLNEPTAAALAYGLNRGLAKKVLVYDLGGGTFDATIMRIDDNAFEVLATGGDVFLGGLDFDNQLVDVLLTRFEKQHGITFSGDPVALSRISAEAERTKIALSERKQVEVHLPMLEMTPEGQGRDLKCSITRDELNTMCAQLVDRTIDVVKDALLDAKLKLTDLDDIILVGGMSRMPLVRERLAALFGKPALASVNADEAVALGAALYSGTVDKVSNVVLIDVVPMTIGIGLPGGGFKRIIERNTPLPVSKSFSLATSRDDEEHLELSIFQGEDGNVVGNEYVGTTRIDGLPKGPKGTVHVSVTLKLDAECVLHVEARELRTRKGFKADMATRYTSEELRKKLGIVPQAPTANQGQRAQELSQRGGRFWGFLKRVVGRA